MNFLIPSLLALVAAAVPLYAWYLIIHRKNREGMNRRFWLSFLLSGAGALVFVFLFEEHLSSLKGEMSLFLLLVLAFGIGIEYYKNIVVRLTGVRYLKNIDDVIDLSFAAALGFTFVENVIHFTMMFSGNVPDLVDPLAMLKAFLIREFFVLPIHLFCSGLFGYFYGIALFGGEEIQEKNKKSLFYRFFSLVLFFIPTKRKFKAVKIFQGTLLSGLFYALAFAFFTLDPKVSQVFSLFGFENIPVDESLVILLAFGIFKVGTIVFFSLMDKKRRWEREGYFSEQT